MGVWGVEEVGVVIGSPGNIAKGQQVQADAQAKHRRPGAEGEKTMQVQVWDCQDVQPAALM